MEKLLQYFINKNPYADTEEIENKVRAVCYKHNLIEAKTPREADFAVSIGGDGTFIDTANIVSPNTEIIGVNMGTLGYLAEVEPECVERDFEYYLTGNTDKFEVQERMRLSCFWGNISGYGAMVHALNDIVITKDGSSVIDVNIIVDNKRIVNYYCDGVIVSSPTGSTGYAFSCGAPVVDPTSDVILVTPIAAHTVLNRSLILSGTSNVQVVVKNARDCDTAKVVHDGKESKITVGTKVDVFKAETTTKIVKFNSESFYGRIVRKMLK